MILPLLLALVHGAPFVPQAERPTSVRTSLVPKDLPGYKEEQVFRILADVDNFALYGDSRHITHVLTPDTGSVDVRLSSPVMGRKFLNGVPLDFALNDPKEESIEFAVWDAQEPMNPSGDFDFLVHLGVSPTPELLETVPSTKPYLASPSHDMDSDAAWLYWSFWRQSERPTDGRWYAVNYGPLHLIVLDPSSSSEEQVMWLQKDLEATTQPWIVALGSGDWPDQNYSLQITKMLESSGSFTLLGIPGDNRWYRFVIDHNKLEVTPMKGTDQFAEKLIVGRTSTGTKIPFLTRLCSSVFSLVA